MMRAVLVSAIIVVAAADALAAQGGATVRARLEGRGLPAPLIVQVESVAARAAEQGLPTEPLADKAIEGFAKHIPAPRIVAAVRAFAGRMGDGRAAIRDAGLASPDGALIAAAAEALGTGLARADIGTVVRAAPEPPLAAPALTVAAALTAQGFTTAQAVDVVAQAMRGGRTMAQLLDIPGVARGLQQQGLTPAEAGRRILSGAPLPGGGGGGPGHGAGPGGPLPPGGQPPPLPRPRLPLRPGT